MQVLQFPSMKKSNITIYGVESYYIQEVDCLGIIYLMLQTYSNNKEFLNEPSHH